MYTSAVLNAVKDGLVNSALSMLVKTNEIMMSHDGTPPHPAIGKVFVLVHPIERVNPAKSNNLYYEDQLMFGVTIGSHGREVPHDRMPELLYGNNSNNISIEILRDVSIAIIASIASTMNSSISNNIISYISTLPIAIQELITTNYSVVGLIKYLSTDAEPVLRYPDYFGSAQKPEDEPRPAGYTLTTVFSAPKLTVKTPC